jgi:DNA-binding NarL/FixJ family response regulator
MSISILLADDHQMMRDGLHLLIDQQDGLEVIAEAANGRQAVKLALKLKPDIVIMDISMPDLNGIEAIREISKVPGIRSLALSMHSDKRYIARALKEGAAGYMLKDCALDELIHAIKVIASNNTYLSPQLTRVIIDDYVNQLSNGDSSGISDLTARERGVLQLLSEGKSTKDAAYVLDVSVKTIETYRNRLMSKLNVQSIAELTKIAIREGLTTLE